MFKNHVENRRKKNPTFLDLQNLGFPELPQTSRARNIFGHFWLKNNQNLTKLDQAGMSKFWGVLFFRKKNRRRPPGLGTKGFIHHPSLAWLACLALACLAILASYRPRSPCLHQQQRPRREAPRRPPKAAGVVVAWCRQGERGRNEAMEAKQEKASQASRARIRWDSWIGVDFPNWPDWTPHGSK